MREREKEGGGRRGEGKRAERLERQEGERRTSKQVRIDEGEAKG